MNFASKDRRAVIVITDGKNNSSDIGRDPLIAYALLNNVPLFTVGLGDLTDASVEDLKLMANGTGGHYYESASSDNLRTIYQQLADVLFQDSYILTYTSGLGLGDTPNLTIGVTWGLLSGNNTKQFTACP